jgi:hypothetical protein
MRAGQRESRCVELRQRHEARQRQSLWLRRLAMVWSRIEFQVEDKDMQQQE